MAGFQLSINGRFWVSTEDHTHSGALPIRRPLLERAVSMPGSHFALLALFQERRGVDEDDLETVLDLVRRDWESEIYILKIDAVEFLQWMRHDLSEAGVARICELLRGFETDNIFENTALLETLSRYARTACERGRGARRNAVADHPECPERS
jgi:hypothetical protein